MARWILSLVLGAVVALAAGDAALAQTAPAFKLGFKALADQIADIAGQPVENEHWGSNGDSLQQTSTGLMVWRKADNWTAFTNGSITWINGPFGVASRLNDQRFEWERQASAPPPGPGPAPATGLILYQADWAGGMGGWPETAGWRVLGGVLVNDGSTPNASLWAPYQPQGVANYAVEAEIQVTYPYWQRKAFGILVREGYLAGLNWYSFMDLKHPFVGTMSSPLAQTDFNPSEGWHKYRAEVSGNQLKLLIDGIVRAEVIDDKYTAPGRVGIWDGGVQISVRSFKVIAL